MAPSAPAGDKDVPDGAVPERPLFSDEDVMDESRASHDEDGDCSVWPTCQTFSQQLYWLKLFMILENKDLRHSVHRTLNITFIKSQNLMRKETR